MGASRLEQVLHTGTEILVCYHHHDHSLWNNPETTVVKLSLSNSRFVACARALRSLPDWTWLKPSLGNRCLSKWRVILRRMRSLPALQVRHPLEKTHCIHTYMWYHLLRRNSSSISITLEAAPILLSVSASIFTVRWRQVPQSSCWVQTLTEVETGILLDWELNL